MKLLFIENRHKTFFYEAITLLLEKEGHEVFWLIQNKEFTPESANKIVLPYPKTTNKAYKKSVIVEQVILIDRQQNHFNKKDQSYFYEYYFSIEKALDTIKPDLVFGESTAFHELLAIKLCLKKSILYLNPSTCRYPTGRFSFYKYDTLEPYKGSDEILTDIEAEAIINEITHRRAKPDYMTLDIINKSSGFKDKLTKIKSYIKGERFNTPNPIVKYNKEKKKEKTIDLWDATASRGIENKSKFKVLYPLQMQPEANIDVWGGKYRNQTQLIKLIVKHLPENVVLYVKPNPKSKYELSPELFDIIGKNDSVVHLHHATKMDDVLPYIDLVLTVTGTIAIECILTNKPVVTLIKTINNENKNCIFIEHLEEITKVITAVKSNTFYKSSLEEKIIFINLLNKLSYRGKVSDPFTDPSSIDEENIRDMFLAFKSILK